MFHSSTTWRENILLYHFSWDTAILKELELSLMFYFVLIPPNQQRLLENSLYNLPCFKLSFCDSLAKPFLNIRGFSSLYVLGLCIHFNSISSL